MTEKTKVAQLPEGFTTLSNRVEIDGWYLPAVGVPVRGIPIHQFSFEGEYKQNKVVVLRLTAPSPCVIEEETHLLPVDSTLAVQITAMLEPILELPLEKSEVFFVAKEKKPLKAGKSMWDYEVGSRLL